MDSKNQLAAVVVPHLTGNFEIDDLFLTVPDAADWAGQRHAVKPEFVRAVPGGAGPYTQQGGPGLRVGKGVGEPAGRAAPVDALPAGGPGRIAGEGVVGLGLLFPGHHGVDDFTLRCGCLVQCSELRKALAARAVGQ
nr:hypothetical protein [Arthrobacter sp. 24S4-2]